MQFKTVKPDDKKTNPWVWFGVVVAILAMADNKVVERRKIESKRQSQENARRNSLVHDSGDHARPSVSFDMPDTGFSIPPISGPELEGIRSALVMNGDDDDDAQATSRGGKRTTTVRSNAHVSVIHEKQEAAAAAEVRALSNQLKANAGHLSEDKLHELERKLAEAGEKLRQAAERTGARMSERSRNVIVSRVLGEKSMPPVPPVPPVPSVPGVPIVPSRTVAKSKSETPKVANFQVRSGPCATRDKALGEARDNLNKIVASRLNEFGLDDSKFVQKATESLKPKFEVEESFREVGGDRYPLYVATANVDLGSNFEKQALRLVNQQTAHERFAGLMGISAAILALLVGIDQTFFGRLRKRAPVEKNLV